MKRLFLTVLFFSFSFIQAQTNSIVFELNDGYKKFDAENCLTNKTDYSQVQFSIVKGELSDIKSFKLNLNELIGFLEVIKRYLLSCKAIFQSENNNVSETFSSKSSIIKASFVLNFKNIYA